MRVAMIAAAVCVIVSSSRAPAEDAPAVDATVTPRSLLELRWLTLDQSGLEGSGSGINLSLHVDGPDVKDAKRYGDVRVIEAVDDAGTDLAKKPGESPDWLKQFFEIRAPMSFGQGPAGTAKPSGFNFDVHLPVFSARRATVIKQMSGTVQVLVGGKRTIVEVKPLKANLGKTIDDPSLKAVGVTYELIDLSKPKQNDTGLHFGPDTSRDVWAIISGNISAVASMEIVDASGKRLSNSQGWSMENGHCVVSYGMENPLPADAVMQIEVWPGQKTITVPFELKDIKLP